MRFLTVFIIFFLSFQFWGCDDSGFFGGQVCTQVGCEDGVSIMIEKEKPDTLSVTVFVDDESEPFGSIECTNPEHPCIFRVSEETPEKISVNIEWDGGEFSENFEPVYESYQPNGPDCPPTCTTASIEINLFEE